MANTPNSGERGRFSALRKATTVLRLLRGESLELLARELGVTAATLAGWRDDFQAGGKAALKSRPADDRDEEITRLRAKVGELTMDNELLLQRCRPDCPFVPRSGRRLKIGTELALSLEGPTRLREKSRAPVDSDPGFPDI
jgi:transposase-like protein